MNTQAISLDDTMLNPGLNQLHIDYTTKAVAFTGDLERMVQNNKLKFEANIFFKLRNVHTGAVNDGAFYYVATEEQDILTVSKEVECLLQGAANANLEVFDARSIIMPVTNARFDFLLSKNLIDLNKVNLEYVAHSREFDENAPELH